jgi:hypothetical protein
LPGGSAIKRQSEVISIAFACRAHQKDHKTLEGQIEFIAYEFCNTHEAVGMALKQAKTVEEARAAVAPYVRLLKSFETQVGGGPQ